MAANAINTPEFRAGFISVFKATVPPGSDPSTKPTYTIRALFPPTSDFSGLKKLAQAAAVKKWGSVENIPGAAKTAIKAMFERRNEDLEKPYADIPGDWIVMNFKAQERFKPAVIDHKRNDIIDEMDVYSGAWYRVHVDAFAWDARGNKGVSFGLLAVQKLRNDTALGRGPVKASTVFEDFDNGEANGDDGFLK